MRHHIIFHNNRSFKEGVQVVPVTNRNGDRFIINYINPDDFENDENAFGMCGVEATYVASNRYVTPETLNYFASRIRTTHEHEDDICNRISIRKHNDKMVCRIGGHTTTTFDQSFLRWAEEKLNMLFPQEKEPDF